MQVSCPERAAPEMADGVQEKRSFPWLVIAAAAAIWLPLLYHLSLEWTVNEQYRYGFLVPAFAAYLFYSRWADRPQPQPPVSGQVPAVMGGLLLAPLLPLLLVEAANPEWRLLSWVWTGAAVGLSALSVFTVGGWPWLRHFLVPLTFIFTAVPWPTGFEMRLVQDLMWNNAAAAVEILHWLAIAAVQEANVIRIGEASVGIDEACSGVRSLQTSLMAGWLLGELHRLSPAWRAALLVLCLAVALVSNVLRTLVLVFLAQAHGVEAMTAWHDHVGTAALLVGLASWILLAQAAKGLANPPSREQWIVPGMPLRESHPASLPALQAASISRSWCWLVIGWMAVSLLAVEAWYWPTRASRDRPFDWTVRWPSDVPTRELAISPTTRGVLKYSRGSNRVWEDVSGCRWSAFHLEWAPGRTAHAVAQVHRPEICLPAAGRELIADCGVHLFQGAGVVLPFRHYVFSDAGQPLHVFFSLATRRGEDHRSAVVPNQLTRAERFRAVRERRRNEGQQQLEIGIWGVQGAPEAERIFANGLKTLLVTTGRQVDLLAPE